MSETNKKGKEAAGGSRLPDVLIGKNYKSRHISVGAREISDIGRMRAYRPIRESHVGYLSRLLLAGVVLAGVITVVDAGRGGKHRWILADGNHRMEAVRRILRADPTRRFEFEFHIYENLTDNEVLALFENSNTVVAVTPLDMLVVGMGFGKYAVAKRVVEEPFPVPVSASRNSIKEGFRVLTLLKAYLLRSGTSLGISGRREYLAAVNGLTEDDYARIRRFCEAFRDAFDMPGSKNAFSKFAPLNALVRIYFTNAYNAASGGLTHDELVDRWQENVRGDEDVLRNANMNGYESVKYVALLIVKAMNKGHARRKALSPYPDVSSGGDGSGGAAAPVMTVDKKGGGPDGNFGVARVANA